MKSKPVILIGAGCPQELADKLCTLGIPVLTTWQGVDRVPEDSPAFCGRPGTIGMRAANIIQQKATTLYIFGARLDMEQVGYRMDNFAPNATKYVYDIDVQELDKLPLDWEKNYCDLNDTWKPTLIGNPAWLKWCKNLYKTYRHELDGANVVEDYVDPYYFTRILSDVCAEGEIIVPASSGMQSCTMMQAFKVKRGQKILLCNTTGSMGFEPMAIGAALATGRRVICVAGDGGFFMNMQELELVKRLNLNIKYFVFCNGGYGSVTSMQDARFNKRVGSDAGSGLYLPDLKKTAELFGLKYYDMPNNKEVFVKLQPGLGRILNDPSPAIIRVSTTLAFRYACKVNSALKDGVFVVDGMEDMTPKISNLKELMEA